MHNDKLKIALAVQGRFYTFDLAYALLQQGHEVVVFTNYPKWAAKKFGLPAHAIRSFWLHGGLSRISFWLHEKINLPIPEAWLHKLFGRWIRKELLKDSWDVIQVWSGVSEEFLCASLQTRTVRILNRGSAHIKTQARLLQEEAQRTTIHIEQPSPWMIAREEREYVATDYIMVLSQFAYTSFKAQGIDAKKLLLLPLGVSNKNFRASAGSVEERCKRILSGEPLSILYVGNLSAQKGMYDMAHIITGLEGEAFRFFLVGQAVKETKKLFLNCTHNVTIMPKQQEHVLPHLYAQADIFVFPTIHDGFAVVLSQAQASGLPILCTTNCAASEIVKEAQTGWVTPIRKPELFIERLRWCDTHRTELVSMVRFIHEHVRSRDWTDVAKDFVATCKGILNTHNPHEPWSKTNA
jgi:glycosyltransferase involved in cell wall biosynthesis